MQEQMLIDTKINYICIVYVEKNMTQTLSVFLIRCQKVTKLLSLHLNCYILFTLSI